MLDEGLSAYHQRHVKTGALGAFLGAVEAGRIAAGSVLVVGGLGLLSRAESIQAQAQLAQIVNAGITVVTASDGKAYSRERLTENLSPMCGHALAPRRMARARERDAQGATHVVCRVCG